MAALLPHRVNVRLSDGDLARLDAVADALALARSLAGREALQSGLQTLEARAKAHRAAVAEAQRLQQQAGRQQLPMPLLPEFD